MIFNQSRGTTEIKFFSIFLLIIFILVFYFNLNGVFLNTLYQDDNSNYLEGLTNNYDIIKERLKRDLFRPYVQYVFSELLAYSPTIARVVILFLMTLLSNVLLLIYYNLFRLPISISLFASILPFLIPQQTLYPSFVIGAYPIWILLLLLVTFYYLVKYIKKDNNNEYRSVIFIFITFLFYVFFNTSTNPLFFIPLAITLFLLFKPNRFIIIATLIIVGTGTSKLFKILYSTNSIEEINVFESSILLKRVSKFLYYSNPFNISNLSFNLSLALILILFPIVLLIKNKKNILHHSPINIPSIIPLVFGLSWCLVSIAPFLFSPYFSTRYAFPFTIGYSLLFSWVLYYILKNIELKFKYPTEIFTLVVFSTIILIAGITKVKEVNKLYRFREGIISQFTEKIKSDGINFPANSQIIIIGHGEYMYTNSFWKWSTGQIQYFTKRKDLTGLIGKEKLYYNPFDKSKRGYSFRMNGLNSRQPIFIFNISSKECSQIFNVLTCEKISSSDKMKWAFYKLDSNGKTGIITSGSNSKEEIKTELIKLGYKEKAVYGF